MKRRISLILVGVFAAASSGAAFAAPNMAEGKWEITTKMQMEGMPMAMPPVKVDMCLNNKQTVPQKPQKNQDCKMISNKVEGNTVTWLMRCADKHGTTDSEGKITYNGSSFDGKVIMTMSGKNGNHQMTQKMTGKRIGDCK